MEVGRLLGAVAGAQEEARRTGHNLVGVEPAVTQGTEAAGVDAITSGWEKEGPQGTSNQLDVLCVMGRHDFCIPREAVLKGNTPGFPTTFSDHTVHTLCSPGGRACDPSLPNPT